MSFRFDKEEHAYFLDDRPLNGVTSILQIVAKPMLIQWAANMAVDYIKEHIDKEGMLDKFESLEEARVAHRKKKEDAGAVGSSVHLWISQWVLAEIKRTQTK